jgi:hypothetical protein
MTIVPGRRSSWLLAASACLCLAAAPDVEIRAEDTRSAHRSQLNVDVALNGVSFRPILAGPLTADGHPPKGTTFIVNGVIYPAGTFEKHGASSGVLADGSPEFPDLVIGTWTCRGWFSVDLLNTTTGAFAATTQFFDFRERLGREAYFTEGFEPADVGNPLLRAIIGGIGSLAHVRGQHVQTAVGFNPTMAPNLTFRHR